VRSVTSNDAGVFSAPGLIPGSGYGVTVTASGFATWQVKDMNLAVGRNVNLDVKLTVAQAATAVDVVATAPLIDDTKSDVSQVANAQQIQDLPINGRRVDSFVLLTPGVSNDATGRQTICRGRSRMKTAISSPMKRPGPKALTRSSSASISRTRMTIRTTSAMRSGPTRIRP
jgi:hypothetical protein